MKSPIPKITAAGVIIMAAVPLLLFFERGATPVYALEQTTKANRTIDNLPRR